jgi:hypothetical protein
MEQTTNLPQKGFYVHYKHTEDGEKHNYMYEVVGIGRNTEDENLTVLYRPLYKSEFMPPADLQSRPLNMFMESVEIGGVSKPRFQMITDQALIRELEEARATLYTS